MKKGIICVMFVLSLHALCAQEQEDGRVSWGVRIGTNLSNQYCMIDDDDSKQLFKPCLGGGLFVEYPISNKVKKEVGLSLIERGAKTDVTSVINNSGIRTIRHDTANASYLYVSLNVKDKFYWGRHFYFVLGGAAEWGWKGRGSSTVEGYTNVMNIFAGDIDLLQRRWDIAIVAGCGFDIGKRICIEYNATFGLINLSQNSTVPETHNYGISLNLGFSF